MTLLGYSAVRSEAAQISDLAFRIGGSDPGSIIWEGKTAPRVSSRQRQLYHQLWQVSKAVNFISNPLAMILQLPVQFMTGTRRLPDTYHPEAKIRRYVKLATTKKMWYDAVCIASQRL